MKTVKIVLGIVVSVVILAVIAAAIFASSFDANRYKSDAVRIVKEKTGRTLSIEGDIGLSVFPKLSLMLGKTMLSEAGREEVCARVDKVQVALEVLPLLTGRVKLERVTLSGLQAEVVRYKDGRTNIDDLKGGGKSGDEKKAPESASAGPLGIDVEGVDIRAASLAYRDERESKQFRMAIDQLSTGRIASGLPGKLELKARFESSVPKAAGSVDFQSGYRIDFWTGSVALSGIALKVSGDLPGAAGLVASLKGDIEADPSKATFVVNGLVLVVTTNDGIEAGLNAPKLQLAAGGAVGDAVTGSVKVARPGFSVDARLALAALSAKGELISFPSMVLEFSGKQAETAFTGRIATPVALDLGKSTIELAKITGEFAASGAKLPGGNLKASLAGSVATDWAKQTARTDVSVKMDSSTLGAKVTVSRFSPLSARFDLVADTLDADRFAPPAAPAAAGGKDSKSAGSGGDAPVDLAALKGLDLTGTVRVGALVAHKVKVGNLNLSLRVAGGRAEVSPLSAELYGGKLAGQLSADANTHQLSAKTQLTAVNIGPILRDAAGKDVIDGRGNVALDVRTTGTTVGALKKALGGTASLQLKDGAIKGINLADTFRKAKSMVGAGKSQDQAANNAEKTDFSELSASFVIRDGVAHNEDLSARSPFLRLAGAGDINIGADSMDDLAKASVVASAAGQGGGDMSGLTLPVRVSGPFDALRFGIEFGSMISDSAKQKVQDAVKSGLKGLFKR